MTDAEQLRCALTKAIDQRNKAQDECIQLIVDINVLQREKEQLLAEIEQLKVPEAKEAEGEQS